MILNEREGINNIGNTAIKMCAGSIFVIYFSSDTTVSGKLKHHRALHECKIETLLKNAISGLTNNLTHFSITENN